MSEIANPYRGEAALKLNGKACLLRPSFAALVAAEEELGPLFALVDKAGAGQLALNEMVTLFWHCLAQPHHWTRDEFAEAITALGLVGCTASLRTILGQILQGTQ